MTEEEQGQIEEEFEAQQEPEAPAEAEEVEAEDAPYEAVEEEVAPEDEPLDQTDAEAAEAVAVAATAATLAEDEATFDEDYAKSYEEEGDKNRPAIIIGIVAVVLAFCACIICITAVIANFSGGGRDSVTGNVVYRERMALPEDAVLTVQILDVSQMDVAAEVVGEEIINNPGTSPIPYEVSYDSGSIDENLSYSMKARIEDGEGNLWFISTSNIPVITRDNPTEDVEILVEMTRSQPEEPTGTSVTGAVMYRQRIALPDDAVVTVQIQDVSEMDVAAEVIGEQIITNPGQVPIPYEVAYDPEVIDERYIYSVSARIEDGSGKLLFISTSNIPVITRGAPTENVEIMVEYVAAPPEASVTGNVVYRQRIALPDDAVVNVQIQDVSLIDAPAKVMGEQIITNPGQVPIPYEVTYNPEDIDDQHSYSMRARIEDGTGKLLFTSTSNIPVITRGAPTEDVEIMVEQTAAPPEPVEAYITIEQPVEGSTVDLGQPLAVHGMGGGLPEGNVVVQVLDWKGNLLAESYATVQAPDAGSGGEGPWWVEMMVEAEPGSAGMVYAFAPSPKDDSIIAEDLVHVSLGETAAVPSFLEIDEPVEGAELDTTAPIVVSGTGGGLPEGNVVVRALDADEIVLAEQATILQGADVGSGGSGTWSVQLIVGAPAGTDGSIKAFSPSPADGEGPVAFADVNVKFGGEPEEGVELEGTVWVLTNTLPDTEITAFFEDTQVSGSAGCNDYTGSYSTTRAIGKNAIKIGPLATTRKMCPDDVMSQEAFYLTALELAAEYTIEGSALTLTAPGGSFIFEAAPE